jgi:hypothetical protein
MILSGMIGAGLIYLSLQGFQLKFDYERNIDALKMGLCYMGVAVFFGWLLVSVLSTPKKN